MPAARARGALWFALALALILVVSVLLMWESARCESQIWDEHLEIASGYYYLKTGAYRIILEHPPLARVLAALPLLPLHLTLPQASTAELLANQNQYSIDFLYHNRVPADTILMRARWMAILITALGTLGLALWVKSRFGAGAALLAAVLFAFDPMVLAHGHYSKNDIPVAILAFLACAWWSDWLEQHKTYHLWLAAVATALAMMTKFSAIFLYPVFALLFLLKRWHGDRELKLRRGCLAAAALALTLTLSVFVVYAPQTGMFVPYTRADRLKDPSVPMLRDVQRLSLASEFLGWVGGRLGLPMHPFLEGLAAFANHGTKGHNAYLLGQHSDQGWWYYFPVAFAVKTPLAALAALALAAALGLRRLWRGRWKAIPFVWWTLLLPPAIYLAFSMVARVNIGFRHVLPMFPFLSALTAAAFWQMRRRFAVIASLIVASLLLIEDASLRPHYLAFFNRLAGGPENGPRYLVDSNIDWGQGLKNLKTWLDEHHIIHVRLLYFGAAPPDYYKIWFDEVPRTWEPDLRASLDDMVAVSVTPLMDVYVKPGEIAWLRELQPTARIGYSIYVYDLRKHPTPLSAPPAR
jgi:hypothetical protein